MYGVYGVYGVRDNVPPRAQGCTIQYRVYSVYRAQGECTGGPTPTPTPTPYTLPIPRTPYLGDEACCGQLGKLSLCLSNKRKHSLAVLAPWINQGEVR